MYVQQLRGTSWEGAAEPGCEVWRLLRELRYWLQKEARRRDVAFGDSYVVSENWGDFAYYSTLQTLSTPYFVLGCTNALRYRRNTSLS